MKKTNNIFFKIILVIPILLITGCAGSLARPIQRQANFILEEYMPYKNTGTATIKGQAFLRQKGGNVVTAAGATIYLNPATSYSKEYFELQVMRGLHLSEADKRMLEYERTTTGDANGNFEFNDLPAGEYYIATTITWYVPGQYIPEGGNVGTKVGVKPGEMKKVVLTR
ncbi:MAG: hypothetical protein V1872_11375 [bacterium]